MHDQFIGQVQARAKLQPRRCRAGGCATLETLGERLPEGLADNGRSLPLEIGEHLRRTELLGASAPARGSTQQFITRVMERSRTDPAQATYQARVVFEILDEASTGGLMDRVRDALPPDLRELATAGSTGGLSE